MKYKVGDKVRVRKKLIPETKYGGVYFAINMREYEGEEAIVKEVGAIAYHLDIDGGMYWWTDEMFEPVEEMSAEEVFEIFGIICEAHPGCIHCPIGNLGRDTACMMIVGEHFEDAIQIARQWKADHEKKPIETEFINIVRVIEDAGDTKKCVYEEDVTEVKGETFKMTMKRILEEYCKEHEGKFFTVYEEICRVKE